MNLDDFETAELTDVGRKRENNEDACLRLPSAGIYCVADGMGGVLDGDVASETVTTTLKHAVERLASQTAPRLVERLGLVKSAINQASNWIREFATEKVIGQMGTTVVALVFDPQNPTRAICLHAGDSRLYRFQGGRLEVLTSDHTTAAALAAKLGCSEASLPAKVRNELTRAVGLSETVELEQRRIQVRSGDVFLLCSDGLTRMVPDEVLTRVMKEGAAKPASALARALVDKANEAGGNDNITVVLIHVGDLSGLVESTDDELETAMAPVTAQPPSLPTFVVGPLVAAENPDTPVTYEGETPTTDDPSPTPQERT